LRRKINSPAMKKRALVSALLLTVFLNVAAEETPVTEATSKPEVIWDASVSLQNQHYWRGMQTGRGLSFEAGANIQLTKGLSAGIWNGTALNSSYKEIDFYLTYTVDGFSVSLLDYYCPREAVFSDEFSDWNEPSTPHLVDVQLTYKLPRVPFSVMVSTMVWGDDLDSENQNQYSTYLELGYHQSIEAMNTSFILGYTPWKSFYHEESGIVNLEAAADYPVIEFSRLSMNINTKFIYNPVRSDIYFGAGLSLKRN